MKAESERGVSQRERLEVAVTAMLPAALGLLGPIVGRAGRLAWLGPVLALPVGLILCRLWARLGERNLSDGLKQAFGPWGGRAVQLLYLLWGLFLLAGSARRYSDRLMTTVQGEAVRWLFLTAALVLVVWLGRGNGAVFARTGRLFFLAAAAALGFALLLALPALEWRNLWPPGQSDWRGLAGGAALSLSLAGYGIYTLCLPRRQEYGMRTWHWAAWSCGILALLIVAVIGAFGPGLTVRMEEPFLFLLEGVEVPGAFRRGEAALVAILALADVALLTLLARGCGALWRGVVPPWKGRGWVLMTAVVFWLAGVLPGRGTTRLLTEAAAAAGNLIFGVLIPTVAVFMIKIRERREEEPIFCGKEEIKSADVGLNQEKEKGRTKKRKKVPKNS